MAKTKRRSVIKMAGSAAAVASTGMAGILASGRTPEDLLAAAESDLKNVRAEMAKLAAPKTVEQMRLF